MFSLGPSSLQPRLNVEGYLEFVGFGICHRRCGLEQIIPNIYNDSEHYSLVFNHDPVQVEINGQTVAIPAFSLALWDWRMRVRYGAPGTVWHLSWLQCRGREIDRSLRRHRLRLNSPVTFDDEHVISRYWIPIFEECSNRIHPEVALVMNFINGILLELARFRGKNVETGNIIPDWVRESRCYIESHYREQPTLNQLAARVHLAPVYFSRKFKEYFGIGPIAYAIDLRLNEAALLLRNPNLNISEVAEAAGYSDSLYFSRLFKRRIGKSPREFRARLTF